MLERGPVKPYAALRELLAKHGIKNRDLAEAIGMNARTFSNKLNQNDNKFTIEEASKICYVLNISMDEYFFTRNFSKMRNKTAS